MSTQNTDIWLGAYKIPWDDPDFSRRMLREHLSQEHDMASRRLTWLDRQVAWIHEHLLGGKPSSILDLGCGPGFYSHRLAARGHRCHGIDFGPASIEYAREHNPDPSHCTFALGDIRHTPFGGPYDLAMILFGEFNVFAGRSLGDTPEGSGKPASRGASDPRNTDLQGCRRSRAKRAIGAPVRVWPVFRSALSLSDGKPVAAGRGSSHPDVFRDGDSQRRNPSIPQHDPSVVG